MKGSVIRRMYAGFALIIITFAITTFMMMRGMEQIHNNFETVSNTSLPLVSLSNQTSVKLLTADKYFKDFLTTQSQDRMKVRRAEFAEAHKEFIEALTALEVASQQHPELVEQFAQLKEMEARYFSEAEQAMDNYQAMFSAQEKVAASTRSFQRTHQELSVGMKEVVDGSDNIAVKVMAESYFVKLKDAEVITSDALASSDSEFVSKAVMKNKKAVTHLTYAYRGLTAQMPELKESFDKAVNQFTIDIGKNGGVLDQHNDIYKREPHCTKTSAT